MNIPKTYVSGGSWAGSTSMNTLVLGTGGWFYGDVSGSYALTSIHYFKSSTSGYSLCGMWGPRSVDVFGPINARNYPSVPQYRTHVCGVCLPAARKLGVNPPASFMAASKITSLPTFKIMTEVKVDVKKLAAWVTDVIADDVDDYLSDYHSEVADTDEAGELLLDWIAERIRTGA